MQRVNFYIPEDVLVAIKSASKDANRSMSNWLTQLVRVEMAKDKQVIGRKKHEIN